MSYEAYVQQFEQILSKENIVCNEPMSAHTTFRVGGSADMFLQPDSCTALHGIQEVLQENRIPYFVIGNGSNLLVSDEGFRGAVIQIGNKMSNVRVEGTKLIAEAGASMHKVAQTAYENGLTGLEFASGIPGTVGGGVIMNAGAYDGEMCMIVTEVTAIDEKGQLKKYDNAAMKFDYRTSVLKGKGSMVIEVEFDLQYGDKAQIKAKMDDFAQRRRDKQPLEFPSAGSTFKRPKNNFAGKLIQEAGLRGYKVGGAQVSEKHCGFVINAGGATAEDIRSLICDVQKRVKEHSGVELETEVMFLGWE